MNEPRGEKRFNMELRNIFNVQLCFSPLGGGISDINAAFKSSLRHDMPTITH